MEDRIIESDLRPEDIFDKNIRPENLDEYVGQEKIKENLRIFIEGPVAVLILLPISLAMI